MLRKILLCSVVLASTRAVAQTCPDEERTVLLRTEPERLLPCAESAEPLRQIWGAHAALALGHWDQAAKLYGSAANSPAMSAIKTVLLIAQARAELAAGDPKAGLAQLKPAIALHPWLRAELTAARADLFFASGDAKGAIAAAKEATGLGHPASDGLWLETARAAILARDAATFRLAIHKLQVDFPGSAATAAAEHLEVPPPGKNPAASFVPAKLTAADEATRWSHWIARGGAAAVAAECQGVLSQLTESDTLKGPARLACGNALATAHDPAAAGILRGAAANPANRPAALLALAHLASRGSDPKPVSDICAELATAKARNEQGECEFLAAFLTLQSGDHAAAKAALNAILASFPGHARAADAAWFVAFDALHSPDAEAAFQRLILIAKEPEDIARALYWHAKVVAASDPGQARTDWQRTLQLDPFGYYGWLAEKRLNPDVVEQTEARACAADESGPQPFVPLNAQIADQLLRAGFARYAALALAASSPTKGEDALNWIDFLEGADQWGRVIDLGIAQGGLEPQWPPAPGRLPALEAVFPRAFPRAIGDAAETVNSCLLLAIMRRESRFDPDATSPAEAIGLLQLLPKTANALAKELGEPEPTPAQLHDPMVNSHYGAHYFKKLLERFSSPLVAVAAYNAGPQKVAEWTKDNSGIPIDEWVERIPFRETRNYVKAVAGAYAAYALIYGGHRPAIDWESIAAAGEGVDY
jgi:soluble lytic murein transglycosylase-like protein